MCVQTKICAEFLSESKKSETRFWFRQNFVTKICQKPRMPGGGAYSHPPANFSSEQFFWTKFLSKPKTRDQKSGFGTNLGQKFVKTSDAEGAYHLSRLNPRSLEAFGTNLCHEISAKTKILICIFGLRPQFCTKFGLNERFAGGSPTWSAKRTIFPQHFDFEQKRKKIGGVAMLQFFSCFSSKYVLIEKKI